MTKNRPPSRTFTICIDRKNAGWLPSFHRGGWGSYRFYWLFVAVAYYPFDDHTLLTHSFEWDER